MIKQGITWYNLETEIETVKTYKYFILDVVCLLKPECNFLHGFFRCRLPAEVADIEVKITSIQGMHIFRRDRTTQLIKCTPWSTRLYSHPTTIKKMKTFLEVEGKMGPIPVPVPGNQFRPPLLQTNPNVRKNDVTENRKRATPKKKFRPSTPKITCPPLPEAPPKSKNSTSSVPVREDTPWPGTGKMSGNLFEDRNCLLPKTIWSLKIRMTLWLVWLVQGPPRRRNPRGKKKSLAQKQRSADGVQIALSASTKRRRKRTGSSGRHHQMYQSLKPKDPIPWAWTWLRQNSNGKQRWKDWTLNTILTVFFFETLS